MRRSILLYSFMLVLLFNPFLFSQEDLPDWVTNHPVLKEYYIGIAMASKEQLKGDYHEVAKKNALRNMASEITVDISGEFVHRLAERAGMVEEEVVSRVQSRTEAKLRGYELVDNWEDDSAYWVYYRLSKEKYRQMRSEALRKVAGLAYDLYLKGQNSLQNGKVAEALQLYLQAYRAIGDHLGEPVTRLSTDGEIFLNNEIFLALQNLLSATQLQAENGKLYGKIGQPLDNLLRVKASYKNQPVNRLPVQFRFVKGEGELSDKVLTNKQGLAQCKISKIKAAKSLQIIEASLDFSSIQSFDNPILAKIVNDLPAPNTRILIEVVGPTFYVESEEKHLGKPTDMLYVEPKLKKVLSDRNFTFTDKMNEADWFIKLEAASRKGAKVYNLYSAFVNLNIAITDLRTGREIYKNSFSDIKGIQLDFEKASITALENAGKKIEEIVPQILSSVNQ